MTSDDKPHDIAWSEQERALLAAGRQERMPGALERGVRSAFEQRLAAAPARPVMRIGRALFSRASLWGTLSVALLGVTSYAVLRAGSAAPIVSAPPPRAAVTVPTTPAPSPAPTSVSPPAETTAVRAPDTLREELQLLQRARTALRRGAVQDAARHLDAYVARFAHGVLRPESEALRVELDVRRGQPALAQRNAARFAAAYPEHPLRERVQNLVAHP
jgi:hypothetical protein